jgi:hypothetical protein
MPPELGPGPSWNPKEFQNNNHKKRNFGNNNKSKKKNFENREKKFKTDKNES